jgi:hypothetical protein
MFYSAAFQPKLIESEKKEKPSKRVNYMLESTSDIVHVTYRFLISNKSKK